MSEISQLKNRHDVIFSVEGGPILTSHVTYSIQPVKILRRFPSRPFVLGNTEKRPLRQLFVKSTTSASYQTMHLQVTESYSRQKSSETCESRKLKSDNDRVEMACD